MDKKLKEQLQTEVDARFLYLHLANVQSDPSLRDVLTELAETEGGHAKAMLEKARLHFPDAQLPAPSKRARLQVWLTRWFGNDFIMTNLAGVENQVASAAMTMKKEMGEKPSGFEHNHLRIIQAVSERPANNVVGSGIITKMEGRHKTIGGNALRAAVLGSNDGLVSNMSLVMGVAGAAANNTTILITGCAGLLAGAISMALGEWLSVQSSRELFQKQVALEAEELETSPEQEQKELALFYQAKGMDRESAHQLASRVFENKEAALDTLLREELGIDKNELGGSAWEAAIASFILFAIGAVIPVLPFFFTSGMPAIYWSVGCSVIGLFAIGSSITLFTGRSVLFSGMRQVLFGLAAAAVTYAIGSLIGANIAG